MGHDLIFSSDAEFRSQVIRDPTCVVHEKRLYGRLSYCSWVFFGFVFSCLLTIFIKVTLLKSSLDFNSAAVLDNCDAGDQCSLSLVESIPLGLNLTSAYPSTYRTWLDLIEQAEHSIDIASFYWTLRSSDVAPDPSSQEGEDVYQALLRAGTERHIQVRIAQSLASSAQPNTDTAQLAAQGAAHVRDVDFNRIMGGGVLHTKLWLIDGRHVYVGSANMDWRSLTQVKELGLVFRDCRCLAADISKLFAVYWFLGRPTAEVPTHWPTELETRYNMDSPMSVSINGKPGRVFAASSPPPFCPAGRTSDINAIVNIIGGARRFVYIAVMDYFPLTIYTKPPAYWPVIDDALRAAAIDRRVNVRLLASHWNHTRPSLVHFLRSLSALTGAYANISLEARLFRVPATPAQAAIPFSRVNHNKYMVTDETAYVGTSNWAGDYFINTAGVGIAVTQEEIRKQLEQVFLRDWESPYATPV